MQNNLVSIIVPFYNVEKYIGTCIDSLIKQTYQNIEFLLVDDCSPDNALEIAQQYAQTDSRVKVLQYEKFECFNIGMDRPEVSIKEFAEINLIKGREIFQYSGEIQFCAAEEKSFLIDNPQRRCPNIDKARSLLGFKPIIEPFEGVERFFKFLKMENRQS